MPGIQKFLSADVPVHDQTTNYVRKYMFTTNSNFTYLFPDTSDQDTELVRRSSSRWPVFDHAVYAAAQEASARELHGNSHHDMEYSTHLLHHVHIC